MSLSRFLIYALIVFSADALTLHGGRITHGIPQGVSSEFAVRVSAVFQSQLFTWGGGTLVSPTVVVTAAQLILGYDEFRVGFGSARVEDLIYVEVTDTVVHPQYEIRDRSHDIGLIRLAVSVDELAPGLMKPVQLGYPMYVTSRGILTTEETLETTKETVAGIHGLVKGFGVVSTEPAVDASLLKSMSQRTITDASCRSTLGTRSSLLTQTHFCAMDDLQLSAGCMFDVGAGFVVQEDGVSYLAGVLSTPTYMCRGQFPDVYTRVADYQEMITDYVELWT